MSVKGRLAKALLTFKEKYGNYADGSLKVELSKQDISSYIGATYETLFRIINELIEDGSIAVSKRVITLLNEDQLLMYSKMEA